MVAGITDSYTDKFNKQHRGVDMRKQVTAGDLKIDNEYEYVQAGGDARYLGKVLYVGNNGGSYYFRNKVSTVAFTITTLIGYVFTVEPPIEKLDLKYDGSIEDIIDKVNELIDRANS